MSRSLAGGCGARACSVPCPASATCCPPDLLWLLHLSSSHSKAALKTDGMAPGAVTSSCVGFVPAWSRAWPWGRSSSTSGCVWSLRPALGAPWPSPSPQPQQLPECWWWGHWAPAVPSPVSPCFHPVPSHTFLTPRGHIGPPCCLGPSVTQSPLPAVSFPWGRPTRPCAPAQLSCTLWGSGGPGAV